MSGALYDRETESSWVAGFIPEWIEAESVYALRKFQAFEPLVATALSGGLEPGGLAYQDLFNYYGKFKTTYEQAEGDRHILLSASQHVGKLVNAGRFLNLFMIKHETGREMAQADRMSMDQLRRICRVMRNVRLPRLDAYEADLEENIDSLAALIGSGDQRRFGLSSRLLQGQVELMVGLVQETGLIAQPGLPSGDVRPWMV